MEKIHEFKTPAETDKEFMTTTEVFHIVGKYLLEATGERLSLLELDKRPVELSNSEAINVRIAAGIPPCDKIEIKDLYLARRFNVINSHKI